jgi:hypothetical protein
MDQPPATARGSDMKLLSTAKRMLRGEVSARVAALEAARRVRVANERRRERADLATLDQQPARLREEFARVRASDLLAHFRSRVKPKFLPGFQDAEQSAQLQQTTFPHETTQLIEAAQQIVKDHCWPLLGFGEKCFGKDAVEWNRDPLSGFTWPLDYHGDINLIRNDGSDARVTWELNRLSHFITLGRAYAITNDERFSKEFLSQMGSWRTQNPVARGVNWNCAMEVALRAMNLLAAFTLFLRAPQMDELTLKELLRIFDSHGAHIKRNLEFSNIATSNHYLADITGLLWIGVMLPELQAADEWREFGLRELLAEMDKQTLADGADYEASTGYHRLKVEFYLYSFVLCHLNGIEIAEKYWAKLRAMIGYLAAYLRPDGRAPLIGDTDSGQVLPIVRRSADDHGYVLALGAAIFHEPRFGLPSEEVPEELLWILGEPGVRDYRSLPDGPMPESQSFPDAGIYLLRQDDLYLLFNASDAGVNGRGSHGHNDALSVEVSACGVPLIVDPGTYLYTANLHERHLFRSTAYHSTVQVDGQEQNTTEQSMPFIIGNEARPRVLTWHSNAETDLVVAEHYGYQRLAQPVLHRRSIRFDKHRRFWLIEDELTGEGIHDSSFRFHFAPGLETEVRPDGIVAACDKINGASLLVVSLNDQRVPELEPGFVSTDYGAKQASVIACWLERASVPLLKRWAIIPLRANEDSASAAELIVRLRSEPPAVAGG